MAWFGGGNSDGGTATGLNLNEDGQLNGFKLEGIALTPVNDSDVPSKKYVDDVAGGFVPAGNLDMLGYNIENAGAVYTGEIDGSAASTNDARILFSPGNGQMIFDKQDASNETMVVDTDAEVVEIKTLECADIEAWYGVSTGTITHVGNIQTASVLGPTGGSNTGQVSFPASGGVVRLGNAAGSVNVLDADSVADKVILQNIQGRSHPLTFNILTPANMNSQIIDGLPAPTADNHAARKKYVDDQDNLRLALTGGTMTGAINMTNAGSMLSYSTLSTDTANKVPISLTTLATAGDISLDITAPTSGSTSRPRVRLAGLTPSIRFANGTTFTCVGLDNTGIMRLSIGEDITSVGNAFIAMNTNNSTVTIPKALSVTGGFSTTTTISNGTSNSNYQVDMNNSNTGAGAGCYYGASSGGAGVAYFLANAAATNYGVRINNTSTDSSLLALAVQKSGTTGFSVDGTNKMTTADATKYYYQLAWTKPSYTGISQGALTANVINTVVNMSSPTTTLGNTTVNPFSYSGGAITYASGMSTRRFLISAGIAFSSTITYSSTQNMTMVLHIDTGSGYVSTGIAADPVWCNEPSVPYSMAFSTVLSLAATNKIAFFWLSSDGISNGVLIPWSGRITITEVF